MITPDLPLKVMVLPLMFMVPVWAIQPLVGVWWLLVKYP